MVVEINGFELSSSGSVEVEAWDVDGPSSGSSAFIHFRAFSKAPADGAITPFPLAVLKPMAGALVTDFAVWKPTVVVIAVESNHAS